MIRRATAADAPALEELHRASFFDATPWMPDLHTREEGLAYFQRLVGEDEVLVAELEGRVAGYAALGPELLDHLYVHPEAQGRGVGSALLAEVKERRPGGVSLWTFQRNERARRFYEARGFHAVRRPTAAGTRSGSPTCSTAGRSAVGVGSHTKVGKTSSPAYTPSPAAEPPAARSSGGPMTESTTDVFRAVNERIRELAPTDEGSVAFFVCECSDPACFRTVALTPEDFDGLRDVRSTVFADTCPLRPRDEDAPTLVEALTQRVAVPVRDVGLPVEGAPAG